MKIQTGEPAWNTPGEGTRSMRPDIIIQDEKGDVKNIIDVMGNNTSIMILRELTKLHESVKIFTAQDLLTELKQKPLSGEITLIVDKSYKTADPMENHRKGIETLLKKHSFKFSQFTLIQLMVSVGILFLIPQFFYEKSIGLETNFNIPFFIILFYVVMFPALAAYYCWQRGIEIVGPNRATMFIQLMPLLSAVLAILIFQETFELYHFIGASFILSGIYLSNKKTAK